MTAPASKTPAGPPSQASTGEQARPPLARTAGAPATRPISGLNRPARDTRCLRFARRVAPPGRKTRFRLLARLYRVGSRPTGFLRKVSSMLLTSLSSFPRLILAQARVGPTHRREIVWSCSSLRSHRHARPSRSPQRAEVRHANGASLSDGTTGLAERLRRLRWCPTTTSSGCPAAWPWLAVASGGRPAWAGVSAPAAPSAPGGRRRGGRL